MSLRMSKMSVSIMVSFVVSFLQHEASLIGYLPATDEHQNSDVWDFFSVFEFVEKYHLASYFKEDKSKDKGRN